MSEERRSRSGPSISRDQRKRRAIEITLSDEARAALDDLAAESGEPRSQVVERLVLRAAKKHNEEVISPDSAGRTS